MHLREGKVNFDLTGMNIGWRYEMPSIRHSMCENFHRLSAPTSACDAGYDGRMPV